MVGDPEIGENSAADMLGIVCAERSSAIDSDLSSAHIETPIHDVSLIDISDALVSVQIVQCLRAAVPGKIACSGEGYHLHVADAPGDERRIRKMSDPDRDVDTFSDKVDVSTGNLHLDSDIRKPLPERRQSRDDKHSAEGRGQADTH
ncbi:hypothetical protein FHW37_1218 [Neorhizobium alkalisoli]|uniref:Uncharacterized protein n=1 Tax=Neorhizobium alkalisoli TaxID=528178 RepID=A0A561PZ17_9HYPH|nr:hypothetical protein FHW37_1218 [Neorhizobium alkalisoli]